MLLQQVVVVLLLLCCAVVGCGNLANILYKYGVQVGQVFAQISLNINHYY